MPDTEMTMQPEEFAELRASVAAIKLQDVQLGRVLDVLVLHLGHSHGLDPVVEDAKAAAEARKTAREEEDARLKDEDEARVQARAAEDAQTLTPDQEAARTVSRKQEDERLQEEGKAREQARAEEDARVEAAAQGEPAAPPVVEQPAQAEAPAQEGADHAS